MATKLTKERSSREIPQEASRHRSNAMVQERRPPEGLQQNP